MKDSFGAYLVKEASGMDALRAGAQASGGTGTVSRDAVDKAVKAAERGKASKSQQAMLVALGIGVGASGVLLYQQHKRAKEQK